MCAVAQTYMFLRLIPTNTKIHLSSYRFIIFLSYLTKQIKQVRMLQLSTHTSHI